MVRLALACSLAFLVSGCAMDALSRPSLIAYGGAPSSAKAVSKPKVVHAAKAKSKAAPTAVAPKQATTEPKAKPKKKKKWYRFGL